MADNSFKVSESLNLNPQAEKPINPADGDVYYDSSVGSFAYYHLGAWHYMDSFESVTSTTSMTSSLFTPTVVSNSIIRVTGGGGNLHGMSASFPAKRVTLLNNTSGSVIHLRHDSLSEVTANNRILTPISGDMSLERGEIAEFVYDPDQSRWLLVSVGSGAGAYALATDASAGIVRLASSYDASDPEPRVPIVDINDMVVAKGLTRGDGLMGSGNLVIGAGPDDLGVQISKAGVSTQIYGWMLCADIRPFGAGTLDVGHTTYDGLTKTLINLTGGVHPTLARGTSGSAPVKFTNVGNRDTLGTGYITDWFTQTNSGLTRVAAVDSDGIFTVGGINSSGDMSVPNIKDYRYSTAKSSSVLIHSVGMPYISDSAGTPVWDVTGSEYHVTRPTGAVGTLTLFGQIVGVPIGASVTSVQIRAYTGTHNPNGRVSFTLYLQDDVGTRTVAASGTSGPTSGLAWTTIDNTDFTMGAGKTLILKVTMTSDGSAGQAGRFYSFKVNYSYSAVATVR